MFKRFKFLGTHLFVKVYLDQDTAKFSVFESSCHSLLPV